MMKTPVREITAGQLIKVDRQVFTIDGEAKTALVPAHTKKAAPARIIKVEQDGRYVFIDTDMGSIMIGAGGKVTLV